MTCRTNAEDAIRRWTHDFHLDQKDLAGSVGVSTSAISHIVNNPSYTISDQLARRIVAAVEHEAGTRITALPLEVVALCHDVDYVQNDRSNSIVMASIRTALVTSVRTETKVPEMQSVLPEHISGVLVRIGGPTSPIFLIVLSTRNTDDEKRALAHELAHLRELVLKGVSKHAPKPPRSSY